MGYLDDKKKYENELRILEEDLIFTECIKATTQTQVDRKEEEIKRLQSEIERIQNEIHFLDKFCIGEGIKYYPKGIKVDIIKNKQR